MRGLRTHESKAFERFFELVRQKAEEVECVFFVESGDGNDFSTSDMEGEELCGWLIPFEQANEFEEEWKAGGNIDDLARWEEFVVFALWGSDPRDPRIEFRKF